MSSYVLCNNVGLHTEPSSQQNVVTVLYNINSYFAVFSVCLFCVFVCFYSYCSRLDSLAKNFFL